MSTAPLQSGPSSPREHARRVMLALLLLASCRPAIDGTQSPVPPPHSLSAVGVVLPASEGQRLLTYCDGTRVRADSLWIPSDSQLRLVELRLGQYLRGDPSEGAAATDPLLEYSRQYLGLYRGGEKIVFVRGVHQQYLMRTLNLDTQSVPQSVKIASAIRRFGESVVDVCDGGRGFFRAEYDVGMQRISRFTFQDSESG